MNVLSKKYFLFSVAAIAVTFLFSCEKKVKIESEPVQKVESSVSTTVTSEPAVKSKQVIASLADFHPDVSYRRDSELAWNKVSEKILLYQYDAINTHKEASAKVVFNTGSELEISQNTLIIIDPSALSKKTDVDRAVMRSGRVHGKTQGQLWILTSAAVIKIQPEKNKKEADVVVQVTEGKKTQIELKQGEGILVVPVSFQKQNEVLQVKEVILVPNKKMSLESPQVEENFGVTENKTNWLDTAQVIEEKSARPLIAAKPAIEPSKMAPAPEVQPEKEKPYFLIDSPEARSETDKTDIVIEGHTNIKDSQLLVNGQSTALDKAGHFSAKVVVNPGLNIYVVQLTGADGKSLFQKIIVKGVVKK